MGFVGPTDKYINDTSRARYGVDVPTLLEENKRLNRRIRRYEEDMRDKDRTIRDYHYRYENLKIAYQKLLERYDRAVEALRAEQRRWRVR